ncbi:MAG: methylated-DNA--[protein]-cysteine S-methyltransferase [Pseudomonadales bacterium]|nr:methylated-DNA--[protein]-cysteine S-methyltransferase [Pseudomonadales bacterium]
MKTVYYTYMESPIGNLLLAGDGQALNVLGFPTGKAVRKHQPDWLRRNEMFRREKDQLSAYFAGELQQFDLPLAPQGTAFQQLVWQQLQRIPYGETRSYGEIANSIGQPRASRAVGAANGLNPIPIIIPCHRVIGSTGKLVGFGGGLETKEHLLSLEQAALPFQLA